LRPNAGSPAFAHTELDVVRSQFADLAGMADRHATAEAARRDARTASAAAASKTEADDDGPRRSKPKQADPAEIAQEVIDTFDKEINAIKGDGRFDALAASLPKYDHPRPSRHWWSTTPSGSARTTLATCATRSVA
jgi:hypothetical protein